MQQHARAGVSLATAADEERAGVADDEETEAMVVSGPERKSSSLAVARLNSTCRFRVV